VRLAFEYTKTPYIDAEAKDNATLIPTITDPKKVGSPSHFAPPCLELPNGKFISQTAAILGYLAPKLGLDGTNEVEDEDDKEVQKTHVIRKTSI
jgi:glutathione S-transferase